MFELVRALANAVQSLGGSEEHLLWLLKPEGHIMVTDIAHLIVGAAACSLRSPEDVLFDQSLAVGVRVKTFKRIGSIEDALRILKDANEPESDLTAAAVAFAASGLNPRRNEMLEEVALLNHRPDNSRTATVLMNDQEHLLAVALSAPRSVVRLIALERLDDEHLRRAAAAACPTEEHTATQDHYRKELARYAETDRDERMRAKFRTRLAAFTRVS